MVYGENSNLSTYSFERRTYLTICKEADLTRRQPVWFRLPQSYNTLSFFPRANNVNILKKEEGQRGGALRRSNMSPKSVYRTIPSFHISTVSNVFSSTPEYFFLWISLGLTLWQTDEKVHYPTAQQAGSRKQKRLVDKQFWTKHRPGHCEEASLTRRQSVVFRSPRPYNKSSSCLLKTRY